ncbi:hypothetical protein GCM10011511_48130 [Puia dinghuensis]|uniref:Tetratricopeptide repeat protein n=1 Tax=Puia dinghuensis TaxID=1792502 RepID=A0A8J2UHM0_9BACT|nr:hypothetical protein GCM10011511_48130 [Puia dinghuensis]
MALFAAAIPLAFHYAEIDKQDEKGKSEIARNDQQKKDSLNFYIQVSTKLEKEHKTDEASNELHRALGFASSKDEKDLIAKDSLDIAITEAIDLVKSRKYLPALDKLNRLIGENSPNSNLLYNRAICYSKTGKIQEAVTDCKSAIQLGNKDAVILHDKINPIQKRIAYYTTQCCDGTTSTAKGRGACSHHGGVCSWNAPVYEESRKYE